MTPNGPRVAQTRGGSQRGVGTKEHRRGGVDGDVVSAQVRIGRHLRGERSGGGKPADAKNGRAERLPPRQESPARVANDVPTSLVGHETLSRGVHDGLALSTACLQVAALRRSRSAELTRPPRLKTRFTEASRRRFRIKAALRPLASTLERVARSVWFGVRAAAQINVGRILVATILPRDRLFFALRDCVRELLRHGPGSGRTWSHIFS